MSHEGPGETRCYTLRGSLRHLREHRVRTFTSVLSQSTTAARSHQLGAERGSRSSSGREIREGVGEVVPMDDDESLGRPGEGDVQVAEPAW